MTLAAMAACVANDVALSGICKDIHLCAEQSADKYRSVCCRAHNEIIACLATAQAWLHKRQSDVIEAVGSWSGTTPKHTQKQNDEETRLKN